MLMIRNHVQVQLCIHCLLPLKGLLHPEIQ